MGMEFNPRFQLGRGEAERSPLACPQRSRDNKAFAHCRQASTVTVWVPAPLSAATRPAASLEVLPAFPRLLRNP